MGNGLELKLAGYNIGQSDEHLRIIADWTIGSNGGFDSGEIAGLEINQWVHVYTHNSNQAKLYVNGNEVSSMILVEIFLGIKMIMQLEQDPLVGIQ